MSILDGKRRVCPYMKCSSHLFLFWLDFDSLLGSSSPVVVHYCLHDVCEQHGVTDKGIAVSPGRYLRQIGT